MLLKANRNKTQSNYPKNKEDGKVIFLKQKLMCPFDITIFVEE